MKKTLKKRNNGFTLLEVIIVIITLAILASVAVPRYTRSLERARAAEGTYFLGTLLSSLERYNLEHGGFPPDQQFTASTGLDIDAPTLKYFDSANITLHQACAPSSACARITRNTSPSYNLRIFRNGNITCTPAGSQECIDAGY